MNTIVVDLVIVYLWMMSIFTIGFAFGCYVKTYSETVTNSSPQLENPMSIPDARPDGDIVLNDVLQSMWTRDLPVISRYATRIEHDSRNFNTK